MKKEIMKKMLHSLSKKELIEIIIDFQEKEKSENNIFLPLQGISQTRTTPVDNLVYYQTKVLADTLQAGGGNRSNE